MDVTPETSTETQHRLLRVMAHARVDVLSLQYMFVEFHISQFPAHLSTTALAFVKDNVVWSALVPVEASTPPNDSYLVVGFHFAADIPNGGFIGWLASEFKRQLGTGVFVVCGQNSADGGVFDYWGIPVSVAAEALKMITKMQQKGLDL